MSGHSHWATIKHKKAAVDAKRGKLWSKLAKAIIVAAKHGGGDPDQNLRLRYAIDDAKASGIPKDNIQRAIKTGTGELAGDSLEEIIYEGYAPPRRRIQTGISQRECWAVAKARSCHYRLPQSYSAGSH